MTWPTHALLGISTLWLLSPLPTDVIGYDMGTLAAVAAFGVLLPDLDAAQSQIKHLRLLGTPFKPFFWPSYIIHRSDRHRGLLHSLLGLGFFALISLPLSVHPGWQPWLILVLGCASHLAADACTKTGVPLFYPSGSAMTYCRAPAASPLARRRRRCSSL
ncbi:MAG: metal-dependent hydrolase [Armatimonadota bacterium]|nr:metal-dependent hydrolase [Armatimonadota bacterium]